MSSYSNSPTKKPFWKRSSSSLPGNSVSSHAQKNINSGTPQYGSRHKLTFKEFEDHTEDAWDAADDDLLRTALADISTDSHDQIHATAQAVIDHHSRTRSIPHKVHSQSVTTTASNTNTPTKSSSVKSLKTSSSAITSKYAPPTARKFPGGATRTISQEANLNPSESESTHSINSEFKSILNKDANGTSKTTVTLEKKESDGDQEKMSSNISLLPPSVEKAGSAPKAQSIRMPIQPACLDKEKSRIEKFKQLIYSESTDLDDLRELSWSGIPSAVRSVTWQLLSGYLPANKERRETVLSRKRKEYFNFLDQYYDLRESQYQSTYHQIHIDIPRTNPLIPLFQQQIVQEIFERLLFVWAVRHPASGYVQGINDLVTPFFVVFLTDQIGEESDVETFEVSRLPESALKHMEADTFWCLGNLLDGIQDNYTFAQPGVQTKVNKLRELTKRVDAELHAHLEAEQIEYLQFAFRWMNNLLMREIPLRCTIRLWDTYLAETDGFSDFHLYSCAAFLKQWRKQLLSEKDFQGLMLMIQNVPTHHWGEEEIKVLLAEAYRLKYTFADAPSHLPHKR